MSKKNDIRSLTDTVRDLQFDQCSRPGWPGLVWHLPWEFNQSSVAAQKLREEITSYENRHRSIKTRVKNIDQSQNTNNKQLGDAQAGLEKLQALARER